MRNLPYSAAGYLGEPLAARLRSVSEIVANDTGNFNQINSSPPCYLPNCGHDMLNFGFPGYVESNHGGIGPLKHVQRFAPDETGAADHEGDARRETRSTEEAYKSAALVQNAKRNLATASASEPGNKWPYLSSVNLISACLITDWIVFTSAPA